ncbi:putative type IX secretion system sortase PorU2 [Hymenobacter weizhouensis]|uniref:putative type IX secretion system sortase PorU2 n=1 Tax=Hymenobacter sp. YIM 151500-1 TaxID=2987689 RepID=UPI00222624F1|nr:C25 family cysteine peptidase [Hymenobacter sp. YIM 151500-1]UYZ63664.1 C25 family cysteine peptidase [Hymenobacter sp. YIM 151500-1]
MKHHYRILRGLLLALLLGMGAQAQAQAQSGPHGNEWIVPGQQYYKIKVARDGLYRLDYNYLTQAGISGVSPQQLQLWRRGRQVAIHVAGNQTALDASTVIEFYGQRNDGELDRDMFLVLGDQPQPYYSLFTDTASYFLTWSAATPARRMAQSNAAATAPHPHRLRQYLRVFSDQYNVINDEYNVYQPWAERGEGFLGGRFGRYFAGNTQQNETYTLTFDSVRVAPGSTRPVQVDVQVVGRTTGQHRTEIYAVEPGGTQRLLTTLTFTDFDFVHRRLELPLTDVAADGKVSLVFKPTGTGSFRVDLGDRVSLAYARISFAQASQWPQGRSQLQFATDSTLSGPAAYLLNDISATVRGYDVTDPYDVRRVEGQPGPAATQRGFAFADAAGRTRQLLLADVARALVPTPARRVQFRQISPAAHNFLIVTSRELMKPASGVANPVRAYADYRASVAGGRYDTLVVTSEQLYDQFHYGEYSAVAIRQFAGWMLANNSRAQYLLLLGKGVALHESPVRRDPNGYRDGNGEVVRNLVPASTRGVSDIFFTADWKNNGYAPRMPTGRISARSPQQVLNYLNKLREHEALGMEPWRRNVLHMSGGRIDPNDPDQRQTFAAYVDQYAELVRKPPFAGNVVKTYRRADYPGSIPGDAVLNLAPDLNAGVSFISYYGHGSPVQLDWSIASINNPANGYANKGKYPVMYVSGCSAGHAFRAATSFGGEEFLLAPDKGFVGFLASSELAFQRQLHDLHLKMMELLFADPQWYGKPLAEVQQEASRRLQGSITQPSVASGMLMITVWHGDPALKLFAPAKPDFQTANGRLQLSPSVVPATARSFELRVGVSNPGRITTGPLEIRVTRMYGSGRPAEVLPLFIAPQARRDTVYTITIPNTGNVLGQNTFTVELDPRNQLDELDETNNRATLDYTFLNGGVLALSPPEFGIVPNNTVRLVGQATTLAAPSREYEMELDTVQTFNSPLLRRTTLTATLTPEWAPTLPAVAGRDSVVWYWRLRFRTPQPDENANWATSSFRVLAGRRGGWSQSHVGQLRRTERSNVEVAVPGGQWSFANGAQEGTITSPRIGPARRWETLYHTIRPGSGGTYTLRLLGIDTLGNVTVLNSNVTSRAFSLSSVSAREYPYVQLQAVVSSTGAVPPQLKQWLITYQGVPEGIVRREAVTATNPTAYDAATLAKQVADRGQLTLPVSFQNAADFDFTDPLVAYVLVRNEAGQLREQYVKLSGGALAANSQRTYEVKLDVRGLFGTLTGHVMLNPRRQPELHYFNNELVLPPFQVINRDTPPVLDVAFDGRHLLNGDIVSAQPLISMQLRDADRLRPMKDKTAFNVFLTQPGQTTPVAVDLNAAGIRFVADSAQGLARLEFQPGHAGPLPNGVYTLEVQGRDGSGNLAGSEPYRITFEVINESSITNVLPYPNPITSKSKFVFTLTGNEPPQNLKIQIVTLTGRVVKEILLDRAALRIGSNITEYAWDGTDEYGDRLANGTYLYRVVLDDPAGKFEHRATAADKAFKKNWGKLVLLR